MEILVSINVRMLTLMATQSFITVADPELASHEDYPDTLNAIAVV